MAPPTEDPNPRGGSKYSGRRQICLKTICWKSPSHLLPLGGGVYFRRLSGCQQGTKNTKPLGDFVVLFRNIHMLILPHAKYLESLCHHAPGQLMDTLDLLYVLNDRHLLSACDASTSLLCMLEYHGTSEFSSDRILRETFPDGGN